MSPKKNKKIVVLGGGFAGIRVVQDLAKKLDSLKGYSIVLVDANDSHVFNADLYEVATAYNDKITDECLSRLKETVATPMAKLIDKKKVDFIQDWVEDIDGKKKEVMLKKRGKLKYDYLVVALGSANNFYGIEGLEEHSYPLKTVQDALAINCHLDQYFHDLWKKKKKKDVNIVVGGGGVTGVEVVAELFGSLRRICKKYDYPRKKITVHLVEAGDTLGGFAKKTTKSIVKKFRKNGVKLHLKNRIVKAYDDHIEIKTGKGEVRRIGSEILIWTGGVTVNPVVKNSVGDEEKRGAVLVNQYLQSEKYEGIYAAGDNAYFEDPKNKGMGVAMLARTAYKQGEVVAKNICRSIRGKDLLEYKHSTNMMVVPVWGKWVFLKIGKRILKGRWIWFVKRFLALKYSLSILPFGQALRKWVHGTKIFLSND